MSELERNEIVDQLVDGLAQKGLAIVPASMLDTAMQLHKAKTRLMRRNKFTLYEVSKFQLLPGAPTLNTVKNMVSDGRIHANEVLKQGNGKTYVVKSAVERLNGFGL